MDNVLLTKTVSPSLITHGLLGIFKYYWPCTEAKRKAIPSDSRDSLITLLIVEARREKSFGKIAFLDFFRSVSFLWFPSAVYSILRKHALFTFEQSRVFFNEVLLVLSTQETNELVRICCTPTSVYAVSLPSDKFRMLFRTVFLSLGDLKRLLLNAL